MATCNLISKFRPKENSNVKGSSYIRSNSRCKPSHNCFKIYSDPSKTPSVVVDNNYVSINNKLVGGPNPKTLVPPIIPNPSHSLDWRSTNMIVPNKINGMTNQNLAKSGYISPEYTSEEVGNYMNYRNQPTVENTAPTQKQPRNLNSTSMMPQRLTPDGGGLPSWGGGGGGDVVENFENQDQRQTLPTYDANDPNLIGGWSDRVNTSMGYNGQQFQTSKFPANLPMGRAQQSSDMKDYNENLFTSTIQPGVYYREDVVEPINANIGISFQQQFLPRTFQQSGGNLLVEDHDPQFAPPPKTLIEHVKEPTPYNVYDPRFSGYGSSTRDYIDNVTGQPRFIYDDVNAVRMPNYISRNKLDTHNFADMYGPMQDVGKSLNEVRVLAEAAFQQDTEHHRNDITVSAMRKNNAIAWQRRMAPLNKNQITR